MAILEDKLKANERRERILEIIKKSSKPVPAKDLAYEFDVSRQIIVQDINMIRASCDGILSTNRGYIYQKEQGALREFKVKHGYDRTEEELTIIVDYGGTIKNVSISHAVYNRVTAELDIRSRLDVSMFMKKLENSQSTLLGNATNGYHYHLVEAKSEEILDIIEKKLDETGFLVPWQDWEK